MRIPAISVIIPLYNAEKYIGECLESILAQTFQDFEVIVVDDCSTDNSVAIVQSYAEKFGGRLRLAKTQKNSGSPGEPGNIGVTLSRGIYLSILDNDDAITPTAFAELYSVAKEFNADVVSCEKYFSVYNGIAELMSYKAGALVDKPTLLSDDLSERVKDCCQNKFLWPLWLKLIRRDYLIEAGIHFANNLVQDLLATFCLVFTAKRFVLVPNAINLYREMRDSLSHKEDNTFRLYVHALTTGFKYLEDFLSRQKFFIVRPDMKYLVLDRYVREILGYLKKTYMTTYPHELDKILREEFAGDNVALMAFIFSAFNGLKINAEKIHRRNIELGTVGKLKMNNRRSEQNEILKAMS